MAPEDIARLKTPVATLIKDACAEFILPRFQALQADEIQTKSSPNDLVTIADIEAEAWLSPKLEALLPGSLALGEEAASRGEVSNDILDGEHLVWAIDPVDGTYNFAHGNEAFCCMVALIERGQVLASWIYFPTEAILYWAGYNLGAFQMQDGEEPEKLMIRDPARLGAVTNRFFIHPELKLRKSEILAALAPTRPTRCAGMDYRLTAEGNYGFVAMANLTAWDHAPGTLLVSEAGGEVRLNGGPYDPTVDQGTLIAGGHGTRLREAEALLFIEG